MPKIFRNKPESCDVIPQLMLEMASGNRYNFWWVNRSTSNSIPIKTKKTGMERTIGFMFKMFSVYLYPNLITWRLNCSGRCGFFLCSWCLQTSFLSTPVCQNQWSFGKMGPFPLIKNGCFTFWCFQSWSSICWCIFSRWSSRRKRALDRGFMDLSSPSISSWSSPCKLSMSIIAVKCSITTASPSSSPEALA